VKKALFICVLAVAASPSLANDVQIVVTGKKERISFDGAPICELRYDITNNSTGTLYYLTVGIDGWDDRGEKLDEIISASLSNSQKFGQKEVAVGSTVSFEAEMGFKVSCKYLAKIRVDDVKPEFCNIRMLPENANCSEIVSVSSKDTSIAVDD
jgi:hypothetical protein